MGVLKTFIPGYHPEITEESASPDDAVNSPIMESTDWPKPVMETKPFRVTLVSQLNVTGRIIS